MPIIHDYGDGAPMPNANEDLGDVIHCWWGATKDAYNAIFGEGFPQKKRGSVFPSFDRMRREDTASNGATIIDYGGYYDDDEDDDGRSTDEIVKDIEDTIDEYDNEWKEYLMQVIEDVREDIQKKEHKGARLVSMFWNPKVDRLTIIYQGKDGLPIKSTFKYKSPADEDDDD